MVERQTVIAFVVLFFGVVSCGSFPGLEEKYSRANLSSVISIEEIFNQPLVTYSFGEETYYYTITLQNVKEEPSYIYPYYLPLEGIFNDFFNFFYKEDKTFATKAEYVGPLATRIYPPPIHLRKEYKRGIIDKVKIDITKLYAFPVDGIYRLNYNSILLEHDPATGKDEIRYFWSNYRSLKVLDTASFEKVVQVNPVSQVTTFLDCSSEAEREIRSSISKAIEYTRKTIEYLEGNSGGTPPLFTKVFGRVKRAKLQTRITEVLEIYKNILNAIPSAIQCTANKQEDVNEDFQEGNTRAVELGVCFANTGITTWVLPRDESLTINVCPDYFTVKNLDELAYIYIGSMVRFNSVGSTKDYAGGFENAADLAKRFPDFTSSNADSYSLFVKSVINASHKDEL